jgi:glucose-6-phosphate 1-dehydrogenase
MPAQNRSGYGGVVEPCTVILFGASGDLAKRKVIPAMFDLATHQALGSRYAIVGFARTNMTDDSFRSNIGEAAKTISEVGPIDPQQWSEFAANLYYSPGDYAKPESYEALAKRLAQLSAEKNLGDNRLFYISTPPEVYPDIVEQIGKAGLNKSANPESWVRIVIEKPFGHDLASAQELSAELHSAFEESEVYRIDHYLGKETVQNHPGIALRQWHLRAAVESPLRRITCKSPLPNRSAWNAAAHIYQEAGALRDMIQSHVLQLTSLVAVEPPASFGATAVRNEKLKVLQSIRPFNPEMMAQSVVRGQYAAGNIGGKDVPGYRQEQGVDPHSRTETFVAARVLIDNWRWAGVPFYLRTGKRLAKRSTEIVIQFRNAPHMVFRDKGIEPNRLVLNIQPDEGISISFGAKRPGTEMNIGNVNMNFSYEQGFGKSTRPAYATLLNDCVRGDATLFDSGDNVEAAWALVDPILDVWSATKTATVPQYAAGSWGPAESDALIERDGRHWHNPQ